MECQTHCCYEQAEEGNTQGRTGSRAQDGEHPGDCVRGDEEEIKRGHLNKDEILTGVRVSRQQSCGGPSERRSG